MHRYVLTLFGGPCRKDYERIEHMIRRNELHPDASLSHDAFRCGCCGVHTMRYLARHPSMRSHLQFRVSRLLMLLIRTFPGSTVSQAQQQQVLVNPLGWSILMTGWACIHRPRGWTCR